MDINKDQWQNTNKPIISKLTRHQKKPGYDRPPNFLLEKKSSTIEIIDDVNEKDAESEFTDDSKSFESFFNTDSPNSENPVIPKEKLQPTNTENIPIVIPEK